MGFRLWIAVAVMGLALTVDAQAQADGLPSSDSVQIRAALQGMQDAWNKHDMKAFVSFMADDVQWVNVRGSWWKGKAEVYKQHEMLHETIFKTRELHTPQEIDLHMVAPGVVVATSMMMADGFTTPDGHVEPASLNALTEVFVKRGGKWLVVEGHNTVVVPPGPQPPK